MYVHMHKQKKTIPTALEICIHTEKHIIVCQRKALQYKPIPTPQQQTYSTFHPTEKAHRVEFFDENTHPWEDVEINIPKPET